MYDKWLVVLLTIHAASALKCRTGESNTKVCGSTEIGCYVLECVSGDGREKSEMAGCTELMNVCEYKELLCEKGKVKFGFSSAKATENCYDCKGDMCNKGSHPPVVPPASDEPPVESSESSAVGVGQPSAVGFAWSLLLFAVAPLGIGLLMH